MAKKIYDVVPPTESNKVEATVKSLSPKANKEVKKRTVRTKSETLVKVEKKQAVYRAVPPPPPPPPPPMPTRRRFPVWEILIGLLVIVILFGVYLYYKLPKAEIEILPKLETVLLEERIMADKSVTVVDLEDKTVPLKVFSVEKEGSQEFPSTGTASNDGKASGTMTIYNKISPSAPLSLKVGTHFLSDSGKYFVTLAKVTVPAMQGKTPGSVTVKVEAEQAGEDYNIGASKFSVPKLSGTSYYYSIWGESKEAMSGGHVGKVKKVTKDDLESARDVLTKKLLADAESDLRAKISDQEIILDDALESKIISTEADMKVDAIADAFTESVKVKVTGLVLSKEDLENYAKGKFEGKLPGEKELLLSSLDMSYDAESSDFVKSIQKVNLHASVKNYYSMDTEEMVPLFRGKTPEQVRSILDSQYSGKISGVKTNLWPFWVKAVPQDSNKIKINLNFQ